MTNMRDDVLESRLRETFREVAKVPISPGRTPTLSDKRRPRVARRVTTVLVAAAIVVVFFVPLPHVSLFHSLVAPAKTTPAGAPTVTSARVTPTSVTGADGYLWMLGTYPCESGTCPVLMRSTDGGKSFVRVGTPPPLANALVFANREDGYAYFEGSSEASATLYWTGSGGMTWQLVPLRFAESRSPSIVIASGRAYTLVAEACLSDGECRSQVLASSPVTSDSWTTTALHLPVGEAIQPVGLAAFRSKVWVIGIGGVEGVVLSVSVNGGKSFTNLSSMGLEGLACDATATSASVLWAFCATGSLGYAARSVDGGREFALMPGWNHGYKGDASNAGSIIPLSDNEAVFRSNGPYFYLTRDGGREFSSIWSHNDWNHVYSIAFADTTSWVMLGVSEGPGGNNSLWRTTNGGRTWQPVKAPTVKATTSTARLSGVVTGQTADCTAFSPPVKVSLYSGTTFVASVTVPAGTSYRFVVAPGSYWLTGLDGAGASDVTVRAGRTVTVNSPLLDCQ